MDIILLERVEKLGHIGDVVAVKSGYARNFLLPQGKALRANAANKARFEAERAQIEAENAKRREESGKVAATMEGVSIVLIRQASSSGSLYGSVTSRNIADALVAKGHDVSRRQIVLDRPIKTLGIETVRIVLHPEVSVEAQVNVARSEEEAELQAQGIDVTVDRFEREEEEAAAAAAAEAAAEAAAGLEDSAPEDSAEEPSDTPDTEG